MPMAAATASGRDSGATIPTGSRSRSSTPSTRCRAGTPGDRRPVVQITSPVDGATVSGPLVVTATATDDVGVSKVDFFVNGVLRTTDANGADGWTMPWDAGTVDGGAYTFTATATDTAGQTRSHSVSVRTAANAQGNWVGTYGHDGYILANWNGNNTDLANLPAGVTYSLDQGGRYVWAATSTEVRALQNPAMTERRSMTWYDASSLRLHLTFANAYSGTLHLYALDWDAYGGNRYQTVTINDGHGPQTAQLSSSFVQGAWIHAPITVAAGGTVTITADRTGGNTAVLAGLFLGGRDRCRLRRLRRCPIRPSICPASRATGSGPSAPTATCSRTGTATTPTS